MRILKGTIISIFFVLLMININACNFNNKEKIQNNNKENQQLEKKEESSKENVKNDKKERENKENKIREMEVKKRNEKNKKIQQEKSKTSKPKVISSFETPLINKNKERISNINLAINKINNYIIKPNGVFSFNKIVGERSAKSGYKKAPIIDNGKDKSGYGGGICQLSSTLYNAANKAGLKILERHAHSKEVHYVAKGKDAAVNYGNKDLKFKNIKAYNVKIIARIVSNKVVVSMVKQ